MDKLMVVPVRIAALMTCYNRQPMTLQALAALVNQTLAENVCLSVYLVDDGSTDGTAEAVQAQYPQVMILKGTGCLFWNGGMRTAFAAAVQQAYDYHFWLNDDTVLSQGALATLLDTGKVLRERGVANAIVSGATCDVRSQTLTSGGFRQQWPKFLMRFQLIEPQGQARRCDTMSGNCVLIPQAVYRNVGNLNAAFTHFLGDLDYGLRAQQQGYTVWLAPGYVGTSPQHHGRGNEFYTVARFSTLLQMLQQPKGVSYGNNLWQRFLPISEWTEFLQTHAGILWPIPWLLTYCKLFSLLVGRWIWRQKTKAMPQTEP